MSEKKLEDLSSAMADIDFTMLATHSEGEIATRPMSNNGDVKYEGDSFFFALQETRTVQDIEKDPRVSLSYQGKAGLLGKPPMFIAVEGRAELIRDKSTFARHWKKDLAFYFEDGIDTPGLVLIKVHARRIRYWDKEDEGELTLQ